MTSCWSTLGSPSPWHSGGLFVLEIHNLTGFSSTKKRIIHFILQHRQGAASDRRDFRQMVEKEFLLCFIPPLSVWYVAIFKCVSRHNEILVQNIVFRLILTNWIMFNRILLILHIQLLGKNRWLSYPFKVTVVPVEHNEPVAWFYLYSYKYNEIYFVNIVLGMELQSNVYRYLVPHSH